MQYLEIREKCITGFRNIIVRVVKRPESVRGRNYQKFVAILISSCFGASVHASFIYLFYAMGLPVLALINIISLSIWLYALYENYRGNHARAIFLICFEVAFHAIFVVREIGFDFGFQLYLWPVACLVVISPKLTKLASSLIAFLCILIFAALKMLYGDVHFDSPYNNYIDTFYFVNAITAGIPMIMGIAGMRRVNELQRQSLMEKATVDELTGLYNRRYFNHYIKTYAAQALRSKKRFFIVLGDIDHFKKINDNYGHDVGDEVLKQVSAHFTGRLRKSDLICRWGGEEFLLVLACDSPLSCRQLMDQVRAALPYSVKIDGIDSLNVTMSFGIVQVDSSEDIGSAIKQADELLYDAKRAGRNCVQCTSDMMEVEFTPQSHNPLQTS